MTRPCSVLLVFSLLSAWAGTSASADAIDLTQAVVVIRSGSLPAAEKIAPVILTEEIAKRTGTKWRIGGEWPADASTIIALSTRSAPPAWKKQIPASPAAVLKKPEGFSIRVIPGQGGQPSQVFVTGSDPRGVMYGVGKLLRSLDWGQGPITLPADFACDLAPDRSIRGHQVGYRPTANSYDAWTVDQFDQYLRDMAIFGANCVENTPFHEERSEVMKYDRAQMNADYAKLCAKYDLDYWVWVPIEFVLPDADKGGKFLNELEKFYKSCVRLDAVFVPGGDPGVNRTKNLMPYVEQMALLLRKYHPHASIWVSMQQSRPGDVEAFFKFLETKRPTWFGGAVMGPSGPAMATYRHQLPKQYKLRWYPDITHIVRCQYPIPWLDPAWGVTIGREPVNPRPVAYSQIYHADYRLTDGFLSYSDGIHDDFNKSLWTQLGWEPDRPVRDIAIEYARFFFRPDLAQAGADAILALETNLIGSLATNSAADGTLLQWQALEKQLSSKPTNWRFDMHLFRAYYDAYTRHRLIYETELEKLALAKLGEAKKSGVPAALTGAREVLNRATTQHQNQEWLDRVDALADHLFQVIGYQTSVPKYHGSSSERGCMMDFVNYPLNDRWWLEDQFDRISQMADHEQQLHRIDVIRNWENPGPGGFYDVLGHVGRSPRLVKLLMAEDAMRLERTFPIPEQRWMEEKRRSIRFAWHSYLNTVPEGLTYTGLDPQASYTVKLFSQRPTALLADGKPVPMIHKGETYDRLTEQEFQVPAEAVQDGRVTLSWTRNPDERRLNWRDHHYVTDIWLIPHHGKAAKPTRTARNR